MSGTFGSLSIGARFAFSEGGHTNQKLDDKRYQLVSLAGDLVPGMTYRTDRTDQKVTAR